MPTPTVSALVALTLLLAGTRLDVDDAPTFDPVREFQHLTGGKSVWIRSEIKEPWMRNAFDDVSRQLRVSGGRISLEQYLAYVRQQGADDTPADHLSFQSQINVNEAPSKSLEEWEQGHQSPKPIANRPVKLRQSLPASMSGYDTNQDGQIAFFEWRSGGQLLSEFARIDQNNDGLITAEEAERYKRRRTVVSQRP